MSSKKSKRIRRVVKKESKRIIKDALIEIKTYRFLEKLTFCWWILRGRV